MYCFILGTDMCFVLLCTYVTFTRAKNSVHSTNRKASSVSVNGNETGIYE